MRTMFARLIALAFLAAPGTSARAQAQDDDAEVTTMAREHYKLGLDAYKAGKYDVAIKELKKAYVLKRLPPLLLNIGATYRKLGDLDFATYYYKKYLDEAPPEAKDRAEAERNIEEIKKEKAGGPPAAAEEPAQADPKASPKHAEDTPAPAAVPKDEWNHAVIDAAPPNSPIDVRVAMPVMKGVKVYTFYRTSGQADFTGLIMKRRGNEKVARIPSGAVQGTSLQYYILAKDPAGTVVRSSGSEANPNIIMLDPDAKPVMLASLDEGFTQKAPQDEPKAQAKPEEPEAKGRTGKELDEENAPVSGNVEDRPRRRNEKRGGFQLGTFGMVGIAAAAVGVASVIAGVVLGTQASRYASAISTDSRSLDPMTGMPFRFNDPAAPGRDDFAFQKQGVLFNDMALGFTIGGAVLAVAGGTVLALAAAGVIKSSPRSKSDKKSSPEKQRERSDEERDSAWYIAPSVGPTQVGVGGGFSF